MGDLENDMDELFRKAANHYPLKTDGADWDKLMGKLPEAVGTPLPIIEQKNDNKSRKLLWLILLFPMGWLCNSYFNGGNNNDKKVVIGSTDTATKKSNRVSQSIDNKVNKNNFGIKNVNIPAKDSLQNTVVQNKIKAGYNRQNTNPDATNSAGTQMMGNEKGIYSERTFTTNNVEKTLELKNASRKEIAHKDDGNGAEPPQANQTQSIVNPQATINNVKQATNTSSQKQVIIKKDTLQPKTDTTKNIAKSVVKKNIEKSKGFYVSALGGVDASSVKSQGIKKAGYSYGMLIGYNLNKHIAFETGLLWDKKQYYTDGEYFNKSRTTIPSTVSISDMDGNCNMFELPIVLRYNVHQNPKTLFFGTAGISSYIMKKENYGYEATMNGNSWYATKTYSNSGNNLFSIVNLSVGYEHKIGKLISLRINPYLNIPLKGLGIGSLPITSSGVNIGITVPFHK